MMVPQEPTREISRQTFLRAAAGALAAGAVFGSGRASAEPVASGWGGLSTAIGGQVIQPTTVRNSRSAKQVFNTNYNGSTPAAVVAPTSAADVQKAMAFAAAHNLKVAPRSGGHSYVGASTANGTMVLDLRQLPGGINYDAATGQVTVTPATSLYAMHQALAAAGRGIPTGTCPSVGAAGHALGGGLGAHSRHAGLMCDQLRSASVVLPGGQAVTASAANNPDLFWALRGGGGGNFGVTTSLTFATFPTGDVDVVNLNFPPQSFAQVLVGWQNWLRTADRNSWALADSHHRRDGHALSHPGDLPGRVGWQRGERHHLGRRNATDRDREPHVQLFGPGEVSGRRQPQPVAARICRRIRCFPDDHPGRRPGHRLGGRRLSSRRGSHVGDHARARRRARQRGTGGHGLSVASAVRAGAVVRRNSGDPSAATSWLNTAHQAVQPYSVGGYVNYLEANQPASRYFGANLSRLSRRTAEV